MDQKNTYRFSKTELALTILLFSFSLFSKAQTSIPVPDHVVILIMENHGYEDIIGNSSAPFINSLAQENALLTASYGLIHPSQPNYLMLFSGSAQGVTNDNVPDGIPWSTMNLGSSLLQAGKSFRAYSDGLPSVGFTGSSSGAYKRKHAPWTNWQGGNTNGISSSKHHPFTDFPSNYSQLPTVSFVVPDQNHDMHDGTIAQGDAWVESNLSGYISWAKTHNSLFILTFDEDDGNNLNHIVTVFSGEMVEPGSYSTACNHYDVLRTLEDMFELSYAGNSATANPIVDIWKVDNTTSVKDLQQNVSVQINPNPVATTARVEISGVSDGTGCTFIIYDVLGNAVKNLSGQLSLHNGTFIFNREGIRNGIYFYRFTNTKDKVYTGKIVFE
ncbi:hypothetical protein BH11BAC1_BH11BAC1_14580 [soil metagenome]